MSVTGILFALILLFLLPIRKKTLIEGVFDHSLIEQDFNSGKEFNCNYFKYPCRHHWNQSRAPEDALYEEFCMKPLPKHVPVFNRKSLYAGGSAKIIGFYTLLGIPYFFLVIPTAYESEFTEKESVPLGKEFLMMENLLGCWSHAYHRMSEHDKSIPKSSNCITMPEIAKAEKKAWNSKKHIVEFLNPERKKHVEACAWCKRFLFLDEKGTALMEKLGELKSTNPPK